MKRTRLNWLVLFVLLVMQGSAQTHFIGTREGLSNRYVTAIMQGRNGLMWLGTSNGLNYYDGYFFTQYSTYTQGIKLSGSRINALFDRSDGSVFVGTNTGLNIILPGSRVVNALDKKEITSICGFGNNSILAATADGDIFMLDTALKASLIFHESSAVFGLRTDNSNLIWYNTFSPRKVCLLNYSVSPARIVLKDELIRGDFTVWNDTMVYCLNSTDELCLSNALTGAHIKNAFIDSVNMTYKKADLIYRDDKGYLWVTYGGGVLLRLNLYKKSVENYSKHFNHEYFGSKINCIYSDKSGMIWAGTDGGFVKIPQSNIHFSTYLVNNEPAEEERYISTRGILSDPNGNIYVSTYKGLFFIDKHTHAATCYLLKKDKRFDSRLPLPHQMIWYDKEHILIASHTQGLLFFNVITRQFEVPLRDYEKSDKRLLAAFRDSKGVIWIGGYKGVYTYDPGKQALERPLAANGHLPVSGNTWSITEGPRNTIWMGNGNGLYKYDQTAGTVKHYSTYSIPSIPGNEIQCVLVASDTILWLASRGGGLIRFNTKKETYTLYNTSNGLADNIVYSIIRDGDFLWLSTENGLSKFDMRTELFRNFYEKDGISSNEFNAGSMHRTRQGEIYFGGINGITSFYPRNLSDSIEDPRIILTSLSRSREEVPFEMSIEQPPISLSLPNNDKFLSLRFALTDFYQPQFNSFQYKIEGIDKDWINLGAQNFLRINHLPAGDYTLLVKGKNMNGIESSNRIIIRLNVAQVYYKRMWFYLLLTLLLSSVLYLVFRFRINQLLAVQKLRTKIASDLHDEVGSMLTRISILTELLKYKSQNTPEIEQIAEASRMATNTMSDVLWSVDARNDKMGNLIDRMRDHADSLLLPLNKNVSFTTDPVDMGFSMNMQTRQNLLLIFKEAVNNIARHSNATEVTIVIKNNSVGFSMSIGDNGTIFNHRSGGSGQGLMNMKMRAEEIHATLTIDMSNGFSLLLKRKAF